MLIWNALNSQHELFGDITLQTHAILVNDFNLDVVKCWPHISLSRGWFKDSSRGPKLRYFIQFICQLHFCDCCDTRKTKTKKQHANIEVYFCSMYDSFWGDVNHFSITSVSFYYQNSEHSQTILIDKIDTHFITRKKN